VAVTHTAGNGMEAAEQYPLTLVTAYFEIRASQQRYAGNPYPGWARNLLPFVRWPLVVFCDEQSLDMLKEARGDKPAVWHVTRPQEFYVHQYYALWQTRRASRLAAEYGLIWNEKCNFLRQAMSENPFGSEMFFWCDIGLFRRDRLGPRLYEGVEWPNLRVCRALPRDKVALAPIRISGRPAVMGNFFGGAPAPLRRWCDVFYQCLERCSKEDPFELSDEYIMHSAWEGCPEIGYPLPLRRAPWIRFAGLAAGLVGKQISGHRWYLLSGKRFPWGYFRQRIARRLLSGSSG